MLNRFERVMTVTAFLAIAALFVFGQNPAPLGPYANLGWQITTLATQTPTLTANQMIGEVITTFAGATTMTTDTAANICALFPQVGGSNQNSAAVSVVIVVAPANVVITSPI